jgi:hypothetical protein
LLPVSQEFSPVKAHSSTPAFIALLVRPACLRWDCNSQLDSKANCCTQHYTENPALGK